VSPIISAKGGLSSAGYGQFSLIGGATSFDSIATITLSSSAPSISFTSIPSTYKHLQIRAIYKLNSGSQYIRLKVNGDSTTSNYSFHFLGGEGVNPAYAVGGANDFPYMGQAVNTANIFGTSIIDFLDFSATTKNKTIRSLFGYDANGSGAITLSSGAWYNSSTAINEITLTPNFSATFASLSSFALYGIKD
jgi:hypothetical protein